MVLKMHGELSSADVGDKLGITGEAARQQLLRLAADGLVEACPVPSKAGRPTQIWSLTPAAQSHFPDTHAALTVQILDIVRSTLGEAALDQIVAQREADTLKLYSAATADLTALTDRVDALAQARSTEGYMSSWSQAEDGSILLIENHCPICAAATSCQGFCRSELSVFQSVLGDDVAVERLEHVVSGGRRCSYSIRPISS
ncbi:MULTISPECIES: metalloregulator ArsR/SmtB family transcription factor [unclassified Devosia]|uniref:helix-turn-helix transcriptional regulator n=1 Tax=unclassified Devosia TaxID=196773 RepID=UPI0018F07D22|nr:MULTISPECIES: metalloregulator ArsR/SmtB family transcription factor [unclassified Devosia]MBJ6987367.1 transcriptional regulator [Devosia sp. MC521]